MTRSLGAASSIPNPPEHRDEQRCSEPQRGGEAAPSDQEHLRRLDYWAALNALRDEKKRLEAECD